MTHEKKRRFATCSIWASLFLCVGAVFFYFCPKAPGPDASMRALLGHFALVIGLLLWLLGMDVHAALARTDTRDNSDTEPGWQAGGEVDSAPNTAIGARPWPRTWAFFRRSPPTPAGSPPQRCFACRTGRVPNADELCPVCEGSFATRWLAEFSKHRAAIAGAYFTVFVAAMAAQAYKSWADTQQHDHDMQQRDHDAKVKSWADTQQRDHDAMVDRQRRAEQTLAVVSAFRAALWEFRSDCLPRAAAARNRLASHARTLTASERNQASLSACADAFKRLNDSYIAWSWQLIFLTESILGLAPCTDETKASCSSTPIEIACALISCSGGFRPVATTFDELAAKHAAYVAGDDRAWPDLLRLTVSFHHQSRVAGCAISMTTMRVDPKARYTDPIGYCEQIFNHLKSIRDLQSVPDASWCEASMRGPWDCDPLDRLLLSGGATDIPSLCVAPPDRTPPGKK